MGQEVQVLNSFIATHPALVVLIFTLMWGALGVMSAALWAFVKREFKNMEEHERTQDVEIGAIRKDLDEYKKNFAVSETEFRNLVQTIRDHLDEEKETRRNLRQVRDDVSWIKGKLNGGT